MPDKAFYDTNLWIYRFLDSSIKQDKEKKKVVELYLISHPYIVISTQILNELSNVLLKKYKIDEDNVKVFLKSLLEISYLQTVNEKTVFKALELRKKYYLSFYDALVISSALHGGCKIFFSEDMHHNLVIEKKLSIINPFKC